ncbi:hypothetical protein NAF17_10570 [Mucilaginibacter sp. RB4R14]|uniref:O-antigen ligase family protein n=1 Tax=Mucilaginibacter aurantiaciroseus TaxID=2949308 RepID=UPI002091B0FA|nr:O-antigen ligase family protein [Mucilaginibacter aurantiaciroseus]MCO5935982.1 hypothetical protein [Mucilaginibacter aurantiaciroseus]
MSVQALSKQPVGWIPSFLILAIMALTGFEFFYRAQNYLLVPVFVISGIFFTKRGYRISEGLLVILIPFLILSLIQTILGYNKNILTSISLLLAFLTYGFISKVVGDKFIHVYIKLVLIFSIVSLIFFPLTYVEPFMAIISTKIAPMFKSLNDNNNDLAIGEENRNIIIYNFKNYASLYNRNSGPFWEPGMFAVFINVALFFNIVISKKLINIRNIILITTIVTTFSTTGYIALIFIFLVYSIFYSNSKLSLLYVLAIVIASIYIANLDILKTKILNQYSDKTGTSRFGATLIHYQVISEYPFTGVGDGASRYIADLTDAESTANGLTFVFVKYGVIYGLLYYMVLCRSCIYIMGAYSNRKIIGYSLFVLLLILAFSQDITVRHFYFFIIIWGTIIMAPNVRIKQISRRLKYYQKQSVSQ